GALRFTASTYDAYDDTLRDCDEGRGRRVITFNNLLRNGVFPLARVVDTMLTKGQQAMQRPVEIEFAGTFEPAGGERGKRGRVFWLQIRPITDRREFVDESLTQAPDGELLLRSASALGNGIVDDVHTVVYVRPEGFDSLNNVKLAAILRDINDRLAAKGEHYILIGPGRWGSRDTALGIPVAWTDIASAKLIVEAAQTGYRVEPSQGTHFFQNLTSLGVGYFTIDSTAASGDLYDTALLESMPAEFDDGSIRIVRFERPLTICINGRAGKGVVYKPGCGPLNNEYTNQP
ncbi:MAG: phosphoenolpyruvate synthase, partial [Muribaculaceae bacterium]|nr:phosphoenolpyruvate synthase [Muribaculaceae bacterium]